MIKDSELRKGNWVLFSPTGKKAEGSKRQVNVVALLGKSLISLDKGLHLELFYDSEQVKPITLTPEILIACGFKAGKVKGVTQMVDDINDIDPANKNKYTYYWDLKVPENDLVEDLSTFSLVQFGKGADILWSKQWLRVKVKSLHQLQNLYYSLTGKELEYKPVNP